MSTLAELVFRESNDIYDAIINYIQVKRICTKHLVKPGVLRAALSSRKRPERMPLNEDLLLVVYSFIFNELSPTEWCKKQNIAMNSIPYRLQFCFPTGKTNLEGWERFFQNVSDWENILRVKNSVCRILLYASMILFSASCFEGFLIFAQIIFIISLILCAYMLLHTSMHTRNFFIILYSIVNEEIWRSVNSKMEYWYEHVQDFTSSDTLLTLILYSCTLIHCIIGCLQGCLCREQISIVHIVDL